MDESQRSMSLSQWVMAHCRPGTRWRWQASEGEPDVIIQLWGYRTPGPGRDYELQFEHLWVGRVGELTLHLPNIPRSPRLPKWFSRELESISRFMPYYIDSAAFRQLVEQGRIVPQ